MQDITAAILHKLSIAACEYELLEHQEVFTMNDVEQHIAVPAESRVKTMVVSAQSDNGAVAVLCGLHAGAKLDIKKVAACLRLSRSRVSFMSPEAAETMLSMPRGAIGLVAPFISPLVILSQAFKRQPYVCFGAGRNDRTLKMTINDLQKVALVEFGDIERAEE